MLRVHVKTYSANIEGKSENKKGGYTECTQTEDTKEANKLYINKKGTKHGASKSTGYVRKNQSFLSEISIFTDSISIIFCSKDSLGITERFLTFVL